MQQTYQIICFECLFFMWVGKIFEITKLFPQCAQRKESIYFMLCILWKEFCGSKHLTNSQNVLQSGCLFKYFTALGTLIYVFSFLIRNLLIMWSWYSNSSELYFRPEICWNSDQNYFANFLICFLNIQDHKLRTHEG